jgi:GntR family transcriptional regulator
MKNQNTHLFQINPNSGEPIYRQIINQVIHFVYSGVISAGDELPSVRQLAMHFDINPMTISKAYSMLEVQGVAERRRGKGMYVSVKHKRQKELKDRLQILLPDIENLILKARQLAITDRELINMINKLLEGRNE